MGGCGWLGRQVVGWRGRWSWFVLLYSIDGDCYFLLVPLWTPNVPNSVIQSRGTYWSLHSLCGWVCLLVGWVLETLHVLIVDCVSVGGWAWLSGF